MNVYEAWTITKGSSSVKVAVIDAGPDWTHLEIGDGNDGYKNVEESLAWDFHNETNILPKFDHGTRILGIIGAKTNNAAGIAGIAGGDGTTPGVTMIPINIGITNTQANISKLDTAIIYAVDNGARVISLSVNAGVPTSAVDAAIAYAVENNVLIICGSGNAGGVNMWCPVTYPASHPDVIAVGAIEPNYYRWIRGGYGQELDVVAPGVGIWSTTINNGYNSGTGTSYSSPMVSGIAALMLSVNPNLTAQEVRDIIESTAHKISPLYNYQTKQGRKNGSHSVAMGYGMANAYSAVHMAAYGFPPTIMIRDTDNDMGIEPNPTTGAICNSPDIWIRHQPDSVIGHQTPSWHVDTHYIYVRIKNTASCLFQGNKQLYLYWAKADTSLEWELYWKGNVFPEGQLMGDAIEMVNIPNIPANGEVILEIPWIIPNPNDYNTMVNNPSHFYLLARIEDGNYSMTFSETEDLYANVKNNNKIAWKHIFIAFRGGDPDLVIRDTEDDAGADPNPTPNKIMWNSPDIWVRHTNDGEMEHQNPIPNSLNYIYVRVKNVNDYHFDGHGRLQLYWTKAAVSSVWSDHWNGQTSYLGYLIGDSIGSSSIIVSGNEEFVYEIPWNVPEYVYYYGINNSKTSPAEPTNPYEAEEPNYQDMSCWHYSFLARIESHEDMMTYIETADIYDNVKKNNNIAWKSVSLIGYEDCNPVGAAIGVWNINYPAFHLEFKPDNGSQSLIDAQIIIKMNNDLYSAWQRGGCQGFEIEDIGDQLIQIVGENASLQNLIFESGEAGLLDLRFDCLANNHVGYAYHVIQVDALSNKIIGGHTYQITESITYERAISKRENILIDTIINEIINIDTNTKIKNLNRIVSIYPNPASDNITITYKLNEATNAYISVSNYYFSTLYDNYILDVHSQSKTININHYTTGFYVVTLICDGVVSDVKTFIKK